MRALAPRLQRWLLQGAPDQRIRHALKGQQQLQQQQLQQHLQLAPASSWLAGPSGVRRPTCTNSSSSSCCCCSSNGRRGVLRRHFTSSSSSSSNDVLDNGDSSSSSSSSSSKVGGGVCLKCSERFEGIRIICKVNKQMTRRLGECLLALFYLYVFPSAVSFLSLPFA